MIGIAADTNASEATRDIAHTNWNLDSDRGYGYKTWMWLTSDVIPFMDDAFVNEKVTPGLDADCPNV
jgi:hypothetical protein